MIFKIVTRKESFATRVVLLCFMVTPKIIFLMDAMTSRWTLILCLRLLIDVEVGTRGLLVSTKLLGIKVFVINSDKNLSIVCSVWLSIFDRLFRTSSSKFDAADLANWSLSSRRHHSNWLKRSVNKIGASLTKNKVKAAVIRNNVWLQVVSNHSLLLWTSFTFFESKIL